MTISRLHPAQRFMYEFGTFMAFWSNFELMMEVGIWSLSKRSAKENCKNVNPKTAGQKKSELEKFLKESGQSDVLQALHRVFDAADRNGWIHGHILNPNGDFSRLTRLRIEVKAASLLAVNTTIQTDSASFAAFYEAYGEFELKSGISKSLCDEYIRLLLAR